MTKSSNLKIDLKQIVPGAKKMAIDDFEKTTKVIIPREYKQFLAFQNGGLPTKRNFRYGNMNYQDSVLKCFLGVDTALEYDLKHALKIYSNRIPEGYFPIAVDEFDNLVLISCLHKNKNKVYFWDHELELSNNSPFFIADSLKSFLEILKEDTINECLIATIKFDNEEICRRVMPSNLFSLDRNTVIDVSQAKVGETIREFGEIKRILSIAFSKETIIL